MNRTKQVCLLFVALFVAQLAVIPSVSAASEWYNTSWIYRIEVTLDNDKAGNATQTDFPIVLTENNVPALFWDGVESDGTDIVVTSADGTTKLKRELVAGSWSVASETMELHVKIPTYSHTADTVIYLYYGNAAGAETNDTDTWDANFAAVYHGNDYNSATQIFDSTVNANHGTKAAAGQAPSEIAGMIGKAQQFVSGSSQYISLPDIAGLLGATEATWESYVRKDAYINQQCIASDWLRSNQQWMFGSEYPEDSNWRSFAGAGDTNVGATIDSVFTTGWHFCWMRFKGNDATGFETGVDDSVTTPVSTTTVAALGSVSSGITRIGRYSIHYSSMTLCELRFSSAARSAEWIAATDSWLRDNTNCYSMGAIEELQLSSLTATSLSEHEILLSWYTGPAINSTTIRAAIGRVPTSITDGYLVYSGSGTNTTDWVSNLEMLDNKLYYAAWGTDSNGTWTPSATTYIEGVGMKLIAIIVMCVAMMVWAWQKKQVSLLFMSLMCWLGFTAYMYSLTSATWDYYRIFAWVGIGMVLITVYEVIIVQMHNKNTMIFDSDPVVEEWQNVAEMQEQVNMMRGRGIPRRKKTGGT